MVCSSSLNCCAFKIEIRLAGSFVHIRRHQKSNQRSYGHVCFRVCDAFQPKTQNKPAKRPALDARLRTASRRISASFNVRPQNREKRASSRVLLISSALTLATLPNRALSSELHLGQIELNYCHSQSVRGKIYPKTHYSQIGF